MMLKECGSEFTSYFVICYQILQVLVNSQVILTEQFYSSYTNINVNVEHSKTLVLLNTEKCKLCVHAHVQSLVYKRAVS